MRISDWSSDVCSSDLRGDAREAAGQLLRVKGANGAGKTSLLRLACGLLAPAGGSVLWNGSNISALREEFTSQLAYIGHAAAPKDDLSSIENLRTATIMGGGSPGHEDILAALDAAGLRRGERRTGGSDEHTSEIQHS